MAYRSRSVHAGASELYGYGDPASADTNPLTSFAFGTLNSADTAITGTPTTNQSWSYDAIGNQLSQSIDGTPHYNTLNSQNQLTGFNSSGANQTFDNNGNTLNGSDGTIYTYDAWNHMATATVGSVTGGYSYDALGRRIRITDSTGGTETLIYSADGQLIESDADEVWITGSVVTAGESISIQSQYVWGLNGTNDLVLRDDNSTSGHLGADAAPYLGVRIYSINDANHDVMALSDGSTGAVFQWFGYDPYGKQYVFDSAHASTTDGTYFDIGFQGGIIDGLTGLVHFEARDMDPVTGRWMTAEPFGSAYVDGANLYQGFESNPVSYLDFTGLDATTKPAPVAKPNLGIEPVNSHSSLPPDGQVKPPVTGDYRWTFPTGANKDDGAIIQHVTVKKICKDANGTLADGGEETVFDYYEVWVVKGGKVYSGFSDKPKELDPDDETKNGDDTDTLLAPGGVAKFSGQWAQCKCKIVTTYEATFVPGYKVTSPPWAPGDDPGPQTPWANLPHIDIKAAPGKQPDLTKASPPLTRTVTLEHDGSVPTGPTTMTKTGF